MIKPKFMAKRLTRGALLLIGVTGAVYGGTYIYHHVISPEPKNEGLIQIAALTLSSQVVEKTLNNDEFIDGISEFGLKVLTNERTVEELKQFFVKELTGDTPTRKALNDFIVDDVLLDNWVKEELLAVVSEVADDIKTDDELFMDMLLKTWLLGAVKDGVGTDEFKNACYRLLYAVLWVTFIGPPDKAIRFDNPFV